MVSICKDLTDKQVDLVQNVLGLVETWTGITSKVSPVINVIKLFGGNLDFPKIKKFKKSLFWCMNLHNNVKTIFKQNYIFTAY